MAQAGPWLGSTESEWVEQNGFLLEAIWRHFHESGEWPEPVELQRRLHAENPNLPTPKAMGSLPRTLVVDEWADPRHLALTIFGLGCCPGAERLLDRYLKAAHLALRRFSSPELPNRLTLAELRGALAMGEMEAERLSVVLMRDADFLAGGDANVDSWDREIDPCVVEFESLEAPDELLNFLAERRRFGAYAVPPAWYATGATDLVETEPPPSEPSAEEPSVSPLAKERPESDFVLALTSTLLGGAGVAISAAAVSPTFAGFLAAALLIAGPLAYWSLRNRPSFAILATAGVLALGAAALGLILGSPSGPQHYRYFVIDTSPHAVVIPRIEPDPSAPYAEGGPLGLGANVTVSCLEKGSGRTWAELRDASFLELRALSAEFGSTAEPPAC
jgi:hypothetical protein